MAKVFFAIDSDEAVRFFEKMVENSEELQARHLVIQSVSKVTVGLDSVKILINRKKLLVEICDVLNLPMQMEIEDGMVTISVPIETIKPKTDSFVVEPKRDHTYDPFARTPQELKNWVKGVIWRDRHFSGTTLRQIAEEAGCSDTRVSYLIAESFAVAYSRI